MIVLLAYAFSLLLFLGILLWVLVPVLYGLPPVPTRTERIRKALGMSRLKPGEALYDLGAGDGRVLFVAAGEFGARAIGIEIGPIQCASIWLRIVARGLRYQVEVHWGDFYRADLRAADVVFVYATSREVRRLAPHLERQLKPGTRLVSISADFPEWEPSAFDEQDLIFVYEMPPTPGNISSYWLKKAAKRSG